MDITKSVSFPSPEQEKELEKRFPTNKSVMDVYEEVIKSAQYMRENSTGETGQAVAQNLYWVAGLLEETAEVNPPKN